MKVSLKINGHELCDYIAEGGISFDREERVTKELTTMNGTKYQKKIRKRIISVNCLDNMLDSGFQTLCSWLSASDPATIAYSNLEDGTTVNGTFYISPPKYSGKKTIAGNITLLSGVTFDLTEQ